MDRPNCIFRNLISSLLALSILLATASNVRAHCDALDGPVVNDAREALAQGDVTPVLKWVEAEQEAEVKDAFARTLVVRGHGPEARELADRFFFETLVRLHRAAEGEPYTGLKPAGTDPGPAVRAADHALEHGSVDDLIRNVTAEVEKGLRERFDHAHRGRMHADDSVAAGREYVKAYVEFIHYAKRLHDNATHDATHGMMEGHGMH